MASSDISRTLRAGMPEPDLQFYTALARRKTYARDEVVRGMNVTPNEYFLMSDRLEEHISNTRPLLTQVTAFERDLTYWLSSKWEDIFRTITTDGDARLVHLFAKKENTAEFDVFKGWVNRRLNDYFWRETRKLAKEAVIPPANVYFWKPHEETRSSAEDEVEINSRAVGEDHAMAPRRDLAEFVSFLEARKGKDKIGS